ncbi:MASE1 domain-containing protein [Salinarimonas ramus]|uniref:MASE1 domain-containing protein n=1 Tax=Salinarimonas ramus TaxID=690164 RepID=A0A917Q649_9HYPH|nr:MASE1 domain-containing protein [Salinarimonas ramus]GGK21139.1 hypothetical protein GCM10011322_04710 [Salinarimonas ramus]
MDERSDPIRNEDAPDELQARRETMFMIPAAPAIWAAHFLASYVTAAIWCAKIAGRDGSLEGARWLLAGYTGVALVAIAMIGVRGFRHHSYGDATAPHDFDTAADRHRFLGFSTFLLAALSFVAVIFVAMVVVFTETCR